MSTNLDSIPTGHTVEELGKRREELERIREEAREEATKKLMVTVSFFIVALSILFSLDWSTSPPRFNVMIMFFGFILAVIVYAVTVKGREAVKRAESASQRSQAILDSINANLARLSQLEERLTQFEFRLRRLEESKVPPPSP